MTNDTDDLFSSPGFDETPSGAILLNEAPYLGIFQLNVKDSAELVAIDMWFSGRIPLEMPEAEYYDPRDPELREALSKYFSDFEKRLTAAIDGGSLKATCIRRNLNEELVIDKTLIDQDDLTSWLFDRGYETDEAFQNYFEEEYDIYERVLSEISASRMINKNGKKLSSKLYEAKVNSETAGIDELRLAFRELTNNHIELTTENLQLKQKLQKTDESSPRKLERKLSTRVRRTLLTIIAALCKEAKINYRQRGAAKRISELTEEIGAAVTDDTIRQIINEIEDAVETRTK